MNTYDPQPAPKLVPTKRYDRSSLVWRVSFGVGRVVFPALLLVAVLLAATSCTIERVVLYNTETCPRPTP